MQGTSSPSTLRKGKISTVVGESEAIFAIYDSHGNKVFDLIGHKTWSAKSINKLLQTGMDVTAVRFYG